ncbi:MAG: hypothetical protein KBT28_12305, partial [Bacteroidales bacterium]|nr:hypothetical protein [Candidatus Colimorpha merdihippi]
CELNHYDRSMKSQFKSADRFKATYTIIIGEDEMNNKTVTIKDSETKEQITCKYETLIESIEALEAKHV